MATNNFESTYRDIEPTRSDIDAMRGTVVIEFGAPWCPICQGAQAIIADVIREHPDYKHIKIEDGSGRPLGRSFRVKLWPTLVTLKDGKEIARVVRPTTIAEIQQAIQQPV